MKYLAFLLIFLVSCAAPESARPESARPESARPESARPESVTDTAMFLIRLDACIDAFNRAVTPAEHKAAANQYLLLAAQSEHYRLPDSLRQLIRDQCLTALKYK